MEQGAAAGAVPAVHPFHAARGARLPVALAAACTGVGLLQRISTAQFNLLVRLLLVASGAALLGRALL
jgi:hypothetical protein